MGRARTVRYLIAPILSAILALGASGCGHGPDTEAAIPRASVLASASSAPTVLASAAPAPQPTPGARGWDEVTLPGKACLLDHPIRLHHGRAIFPSPHGTPLKGGGDHRRYAELIIHEDDTGQVVRTLAEVRGRAPVFAVSLGCNNRGGMAGGYFWYSIALYQGRAFLGLLTAQQRFADRNATLLQVASSGRDRVVIREAFYGPEDGTCCPTGVAMTTWSLADGRARSVSSRVVRLPKG